MKYDMTFDGSESDLRKGLATLLNGAYVQKLRHERELERLSDGGMIYKIQPNGHETITLEIYRQ